MEANYYEILEIPSDADEREIKRAYHRLARDLHPDKAGTPEEAKSCEERFALVSAAYNTLKDINKRAEHDKRVQGPPSAGGAQARKAPATAAVLQAPRAVPNAGAGSGVRSGDANGANRAAQGLTPQRISIAQKAFAKGMQFYKEANFVKAIEFFDAAIQNNDTEALYHARLAVSLIQAKKSATRAIDAAQRAIELDPYNLEHKFDLATIYETIGSKSNAQRMYEEILRWDAGNTRASGGLLRMKKNLAPAAFGPVVHKLNMEPVSGGSFFKQILSRFKR